MMCDPIRFLDATIGGAEGGAAREQLMQLVEVHWQDSDPRTGQHDETGVRRVEAQAEKAKGYLIPKQRIILAVTMSSI